MPEDGMEQIPLAELERTMTMQEVILRAMAKKITWWQAAEILGISNRTMRRWKWQYENEGFKGLLDGRKGKPSWKRVPAGETERILSLYRDRYFERKSIRTIEASTHNADAPVHPSDEFPAGYSLTRCSPAKNFSQPQ